MIGLSLHSGRFCRFTLKAIVCSESWTQSPVYLEGSSADRRFSAAASILLGSKSIYGGDERS